MYFLVLPQSPHPSSEPPYASILPSQLFLFKLLLFQSLTHQDILLLAATLFQYSPSSKNSIKILFYNTKVFLLDYFYFDFYFTNMIENPLTQFFKMKNHPYLALQQLSLLMNYIMVQLTWTSNFTITTKCFVTNLASFFGLT